MAAPPAQPPRSPDGGRPRKARRSYVRSIVLLAVFAVALHLVIPALVSVFSSWRSLRDVDSTFVVLVLGLEGLSYVCLWQVDRIALRSTGWFRIACAQLAGNALGRIVPGSATPFSVSLLRDAGLDAGQAAAGLTTSTVLQLATALALPVLSVPALLAGAPVNHSLVAATYIGVASLVLLSVTGAVVLHGDRLLGWVGRTIQTSLNRTIRRHHPITGLPQELLRDRDFVRSTLDRRWRSALAAAIGNTLLDYLALLSALQAVGARPHPSLVVLAYASAELLAQIPLTPGGLGFVEAGLVGTLTLAGVPAPDALAATLLYRLVAYWLPIPLGGLAYLLLRRRNPKRAS